MATRIIALGNPGSGKSTILNTAIGAAIFTSGMSAGHGIMPKDGNHKISYATYVDTPGLADVEFREQAAAYISRELSVGGYLKLVFVLKSDDLTLRHEDLATVQLVLTALAERGYEVKNRYSIILNQLFLDEINQIDSNQAVRERIFYQLNSRHQTDHILKLPLDMGAKNKSNHLLDYRADLLTFLLHAPFIHVKKGEPFSVRPSEFDKAREDAEQKLRGLQTVAREQRQMLENANKALAEVTAVTAELEELQQCNRNRNSPGRGAEQAEGLQRPPHEHGAATPQVADMMEFQRAARAEETDLRTCNPVNHTAEQVQDTRHVSRGTQTVTHDVKNDDQGPSIINGPEHAVTAYGASPTQSTLTRRDGHEPDNRAITHMEQVPAAPYSQTNYQAVQQTDPVREGQMHIQAEDKRIGEGFARPEDLHFAPSGETEARKDLYPPQGRSSALETSHDTRHPAQSSNGVRVYPYNSHYSVPIGRPQQQHYRYDLYPKNQPYNARPFVEPPGTGIQFQHEDVRYPGQPSRFGASGYVHPVGAGQPHGEDRYPSSGFRTPNEPLNPNGITDARNEYATRGPAASGSPGKDKTSKRKSRKEKPPVRPEPRCQTERETAGSSKHADPVAVQSSINDKPAKPPRRSKDNISDLTHKGLRFLPGRK